MITSTHLSDRKIIAVTQYLTRTHGQGKINLELLTRLANWGETVDYYSTWADDSLTSIPRMIGHTVRVPRRLPTNWLRCETFRLKAQHRLRDIAKVDINNGAAVVKPSKVNIAMFVHSAWRHRLAENRKWNVQSLLETAFTAQQRKLEKRAFAQADHIAALSPHVKSELVDFCGLEESRIVVIPPGVDSKTFRPLGRDEVNLLRRECRLTAEGDPVLALFVGEIRSGRKNLDLVLDAVTRVPEIHLAVIGDSRGSRYPARSEQLKIGGRVHFLGKRSDVPELMRGADFFIFPSHYEPYGLVVTEAMSSGLPVITTRQTGASSAVSNGGDGCLIADGFAIDELISAIATIGDSETRQRMSIAARQRAVELTWDAMAARYQSLLGV